MSEELVMFGGAGHARAVAAVLEQLGDRIVAIVDPGPTATAGGSIELLHSDAEGARFAKQRGCGAVLGIGDNARRLAIATELIGAGIRLPAIAARTATVDDPKRLGAGTVLMEHAHVGPGASTGIGCVLNTGAIVEHDCELGDGVHCAPGAKLGGKVRCGDRVLVGLGAAALPGTVLGSGATVGAGAVVVEAVAEGATVAGVPAAPLDRGAAP